MKKNLVLLFAVVIFLTACSSSSGKIKGIDDVKDKRVATVGGTYAVDYINENLSNASLVETKDLNSAIETLKSDKADCIIYDTAMLEKVVDNDKTYKVLPDAVSFEKYALAVAKGNSELLNEIDIYIAKIKNNGILRDMVSRWGSEGIASIPNIENKGDNGEIKIGVPTDIALPTCQIVNGEPIGFAVEIANRFAGEYGYVVKFVPQSFATLISSLENGEIDIISSDLIVTDERAKKIDFSEVYNNTSISIMIVDNAPKNPVLAGIYNFFVDIGNSINSNFIIENRWQLILKGLLTTMIISIFSLIFGTIFGAGVCALRRSKIGILSLIAKVYVRIIQGTPIIVMLMILYYVIFGSINIDAIVVAIIGFSVNFAAYASEMFRTGIDSVDKGQLEAAQGTGFSKFQTFVLITLPQAARQIIPVFRGEFINMVKTTSVVGYIAIQDLTKMSDIIRSRTYEAFFPLVVTALIYFGITYIFVIILNSIEKSIDPKRRKRAIKGVVTND